MGSYDEVLAKALSGGSSRGFQSILEKGYGQYHEPPEELSPEAREIVRAVESLKEEIEAIGWYHQRIVASNDSEIQAVLVHNRDEEIEHACMLIEWLRRNMPGWDEKLRETLFTDGPIPEKG